MQIMNATNARANLYKLIEQVNTWDEPVFITGKKKNAVLISEEEWRSIQETFYLTSIPGMKDSILAAAAEPLEEGSDTLEW